MITGLDHIVLLAHDIGAAAATYEKLLAQGVAWRTRGDGALGVVLTDDVAVELRDDLTRRKGGHVRMKRSGWEGGARSAREGC